MKLLPVFAVFLLAACSTGEVGDGAEDAGSSDGDAADPPVLAEQCDAADYRALIGTSIAATTLEAGPKLRVFGEDDIVTQEYLPQRTNIVYDESGDITRVWCG